MNKHSIDNRAVTHYFNFIFKGYQYICLKKIFFICLCLTLTFFYCTNKKFPNDTKKIEHTNKKIGKKIKINSTAISSKNDKKQDFIKIIQEPKNQLSFKIKILTWNVWFKNIKGCKKARIKFIIDEINRLDIDIVCLQEIDKEILETIQQYEPNYKIYKGNVNNIEKYSSYDTIILSKHKLISQKREFFINYGNQKRNILECKFKIEIEANKFINLTVYNFHLESLEHNHNIRQTQFKELSKKFIRDNYFIAMGDTNFLDGENDPNIPSYCSDVFLELNAPTKYRWTYDGLKNSNVSEDKDNPGSKWPSARLDRIYINNNKLLVNSLTFLGTEASIFSPIERKNISPSDHYGVFATIEKIDKKFSL